MYQKVEGNPNLCRDTNSMAIINVNDDAYQNYIKKRNADRKREAEHEQMKSDIRQLKIVMEKLLAKLES